ncbi:acetyltransferase [Robertkochia flava]|uniref:acetyltransferase n=1 Tax=Robertkochia flava TaxID=3447986 RepID=UPI001CD02004|nr:acetyltransferase [Robertkochia marina]
MIIVGAKGMAKEVLSFLTPIDKVKDIAFFDDVSSDLPTKIYNEFPILRSENQVKEFFKEHGFSFTLGLGNPEHRELLACRFIELGGQLISVFCDTAKVGIYGTYIGNGTILSSGVVVTNDVLIGEGCLINTHASISHDSKLGNYTEVAPKATITGNCVIGNKVFVGAGATILPKITIGDNAIIAAGAVVTKDVPENHLAIGVPAKLIPRAQN